MFQKKRKEGTIEGSFHLRVWEALKLSAFSLILPVCFYLSIFDEPLFNKTVIMIGFAVFCIYVFSWRKPEGTVSYVDRFVILMVVAACLTTLRASDLMADQQGIAYTHIEELQRLLSAAFLSTYLYHRQKKAFRIGMYAVSWMIWVSAVYQLVHYIPVFQSLGPMDSVSAMEQHLQAVRGCSVYRNPIPCATCFVIGFALPLVKWRQVRWTKWLDIALKVVYLPAVLITYARSGWVGFAVLAACLAFAAVKLKNGKIGKWWFLILAVPAATACLLYILTVVHGKRLAGSVGRVKYWIYTLTVFFPARPLVSKLFGNGFYTSIIMDQTPVAMPGFPANDNAFVTIFYEQGILGFAAVMSLLWRAVKSVWRVDQDWAYGAALIGACATACFYEMHFWAQAGFLAAVLTGVFWGRRCGGSGTMVPFSSRFRPAGGPSAPL